MAGESDRGWCAPEPRVSLQARSDYGHHMPTEKHSIQDVARRAGVSIATVSRAFQYPDKVAQSTRETVEAAARELNYTPNAQARSLRTAKTNLIVTLIPEIGNSFFSDVIRGAEDVAKRYGYSLLLGDARNGKEDEQRYGDMVSSRQVDGMLTMVGRVPPIRGNGRVPVVNTCEPIDVPGISSVGIDNVAAFREGIEYLISIGHRDIAFIGGQSKSTLARKQGYDEALAKAGIPLRSERCKIGDFSIAAGHRAANLILSYGIPVTAIACCSDELAIGAMQAIKDSGRSVPDDVSVLGFDDISFAKYTDPPLSTVAQPREQLGSEAMLMLMQLLADHKLPPRQLILRTQLVVRGTTRPRVP